MDRGRGRDQHGAHAPDHHNRRVRQLLADTAQGHIGGTGIPVPPAQVASATLGKGAEVGILRMAGSDVDENDPQMVTIAINAQPGSAVTGSEGAFSPLGGGPLVGIVTWGSGLGAQNRAEFDLPLQGPINPNAANPLPSVFGSGVLVSVPASALEIKCRNDARFIPPGGTDPIGNIAVAPVVTASLGTSERGGPSKLFYTQWLVSSVAGGLAAAATIFCPIPAFAKSFRIMRQSAAQTISFTVNGSTLGIDGPYNVAANAMAPNVELSGNTYQINITNTGAGVIQSLAVLFEIGL